MGYVKSNRKIERKYLLFVSINCRGVDRVGGWGGGGMGGGGGNIAWLKTRLGYQICPRYSESSRAFFLDLRSNHQLVG